MSSPQPSEISERQEYFEDWLLELSNVEDRKMVVNEESAKRFIKETFDKDNSLSNLRVGMDQVEATYQQLIKGEFIKNLIQENTDGVPLKLTKKPVPRSSVKITRQFSLAEKIPRSDRATRRLVIERVYTPSVQKTTGYEVILSKKGRQLYRNKRTGKFVSYATMMRFADPIVKSSPKKRAEIERLLRKEETEGS